jgi:ubiquitin carboxyl-terminal hydrolase 10
MRIFGGKFRSTVRAPNQPDTVTIEDWQSLQLNIQVRFPTFHFTYTYVLVTDVETLQKHDSVHTIQDALARISHQQTVQLGLSEAGQQVLVEALPSVLVLHLKRFLYDKATNGIVKISKSVQFAPELEIPLGTIFSFVSLALAKD